MTKPNPGTSSLPFGADGGGVFVVVVVVPAEGADAAADVGWDVSCFAGAATGGGSAATGGGSGAGAGGGGAGGGGAIGLTGLTGLFTFVGFVTLFTQLFCVSIQEPTTCGP